MNIPVHDLAVRVVYCSFSMTLHMKLRAPLRLPAWPGLLALLALLAPVVLPSHAAEAAAVAPPASPILDPEKEGMELAVKLRSAFPSSDSEVRGVLETRTETGRSRKQPLQCTIKVSPTNWVVTYRAGDPVEQERLEVLTIVHTPGQPNAYRLELGTNAAAGKTSPPAVTTPLAGSDFWVLDLGLDFLHWPVQRALRAEMSRGRPARVIESVTPAPVAGGYTRVLSWIDLETGGVLQAEAFGMQTNRPLKKFALGSFEKVAGQWQLRDMRMRNLKAGTQSELKFELNKPAE